MSRAAAPGTTGGESAAALGAGLAGRDRDRRARPAPGGFTGGARSTLPPPTHRATEALGDA